MNMSMEEGKEGPATQMFRMLEGNQRRHILTSYWGLPRLEPQAPLKADLSLLEIRADGLWKRINLEACVRPRSRPYIPEKLDRDQR